MASLWIWCISFSLLRVIRSLILFPAAVFVRNTRLADMSHQDAFALSRCNTEQFRRRILNYIVVACNGLPLSAFDGWMQHFQWFLFSYLVIFSSCFFSELFAPSHASVLLTPWPCLFSVAITSLRPLFSSGLLNINNNNILYTVEYCSLLKHIYTL